MSWIILIASGVLESVWALSLAESKGFKKLWPSILFGVALTLSMAGLAIAMLEIPMGTAYTVWVGVGATLTAVYGFFTTDKATLAKVLLLLLLIASVIGLKVVS
ncbi:MAG: QacE family quaternary ammonium compound efflux SMR transporter [Microbacteriaceae bacterium]|nr:QacE family quaternary ammonium compound efflux SMR transporter [Microbacteriaceae bacterium]